MSLLNAKRAYELVDTLYRQHGYGEYLGDRYLFAISYSDWKALYRSLWHRFNIHAADFSPFLRVEGMLFVPLFEDVGRQPEVMDRDRYFRLLDMAIGE